MGGRGFVFTVLLGLVILGVATCAAVTVDRFSWDVTITRWTQRFDVVSFGLPRELLFYLGVFGLSGLVAVTVAGFLWVRRHRIEALFVALVSVPDMLNLLLRDLIGRPRPTADLVEVIGGPQGYSFPSGHALHVLLLYGFLLYLATRFFSSKPLLRTLFGIGSFFILLSGVWLIYNGRHWFTDVMGGYLYGAFYLFLLIASYNWAKAWLQSHGPLRLPQFFPQFLRRTLEADIRGLALLLGMVLVAGSAFLFLSATSGLQELEEGRALFGGLGGTVQSLTDALGITSSGDQRDRLELIRNGSVVGFVTGAILAVSAIIPSVRRE